MFPGFLKPVKSCMSKNAFRIKDRNELSSRAQEALLPELFILPFQRSGTHVHRLGIKCQLLVV